MILNVRETERVFNKHSDDLRKALGTTKEVEVIVYFRGEAATFDMRTKEDFAMTSSFASVYVSEMPGCCGILIHHGMEVLSRYRGRGIGTILHRFLCDMAIAHNYTVLMCTDISTNAPQDRLLRKCGWNVVLGFTNIKSGNQVKVYANNLREHTV